MNLPFGISYEAEFHGYGVLFLLLLLCGGIYIFLTNRYKKGSTTVSKPSTAWMIPFLRTITLFLILLLVFAPELRIHREYEVPKRLAMIVDQSRSMQHAWETGEDDLHEAIEGAMDELKTNHGIDLFSMAGERLSDLDSEYDDELSFFGWNPLEFNDVDGGELYEAAFLISDGHLNGGRSPLDMSWSKSLSVNIIYPLQPKSQASLEVFDLQQFIRESTSTEQALIAKIRQEGLLERTAKLQVLTLSDQLVEESSFLLERGYHDVRIPIPVMHDNAMQVKVRLSLMDGSLMSERVFTLTGKKEAPIVLLVSERINELHRFLMQNLPDSLFQLHVVQGTRNLKANDHLVEIPTQIDLLVLNNPGEEVLRELNRSVINLEALHTVPSILFWEDAQKVSPVWSDLLGITNFTRESSEDPQMVHWSEQAGEHAFYLGLLGQGFKSNELLNFAPVNVAGQVPFAEGSAALIMSGFGSKTHPVLSLRQQPPQAIFSGGGLWKWFFHPQSMRSSQTLWSYLLTYLQEIGDFKPVQLKVPTVHGSTGAYIVGDVVVKDLNHRNLRGVELRVWQEDLQGEKSPLNLTDTDVGSFQVQVDTKREGQWLVIAQAYRFGELWGSDTSRIQLTSFNGEDQSSGVDEVFLARLASRSGGSVIQLGVDKLPNVPADRLKREASYHYGGVRSPLIFGIAFLLLILEWIMRRRSGLL